MSSSLFSPFADQQELIDIDIANSELRSARNLYHRVLENAKVEDPVDFSRSASVFLSERQLQRAEEVLNDVVSYYANLHRDDDAQPPPSNPPLTIIGPVIEIEDSDDEQETNETNGDPEPSPDPAPAYSSWPATPTHFYAALPDELTGNCLATPTTPTRRHEDAGGESQLPSTPPSTQPRPFTQISTPTPATPATSRHVISQATTIVGEGGILTSPAPTKKHYIVTKGRRTGIYRAWPVAQGYVSGLGSKAAWQGFDSYREAFDAYMGARERGLLRVVRLPEDTDKQYDPIDAAEDI